MSNQYDTNTCVCKKFYLLSSQYKCYESSDFVLVHLQAKNNHLVLKSLPTFGNMSRTKYTTKHTLHLDSVNNLKAEKRQIESY